MGNHMFMLFFGNPRRMLWTLAGVAVLFAVIDPPHFHWVMTRAFNALWPWIQVGGMLAVGAGVLLSICKPHKGGGKKDG